MSRNNDGLTDRQAEFLNTLALGRMTTEEVERHLGMACHTLRRWMDEKPFMDAWAKTNRLLHLRRGADDAVLGKAAGARPEGMPPDVPAHRATQEDATNDPDDAGGSRPRRAREAAPAAQPKSDRDLVRLRHGEEAARAFEDLLRRHAAPVHPGPAPESVPPASAPPPPPPPPLAPAPGNPPD
jgi:hypothetical protein